MAQRQKLIEGINPEISNEDYHGDKRYLSSSNLKMILKDPEKFHKEIILGDKEEKQVNAFDEGSLCHTLILEPEQVEAEYAFFDGMRKAGKLWEAFKADKANEGKTILSKAQKLKVERWVESYKKRKVAVSLIDGGCPEHTVAGELLGVPVKARADYLNLEKGYIADVKTTSNPTDVDNFKFVIEQFGYQLSAALYCDLFKQAYGQDFDFYFIVLGKRDLDCQVYKMSEESMTEGRRMVIQALREYKRRVGENDWTTAKKAAIVEDDDYKVLEV